MSVKNLQEILLYISIYAIIIPIILGLRHFVALTKPMRFFLCFLIIALCFDTYSVVTANNNINNMPGLHLYTAVEYVGIAYFFSLRSTKPNLTTAIRLSLVVFTLFACYYAFFIGNLFNYNAPVRTISAALITVMASYFMLKDMQHHHFPTPVFYITTGILLYFMVNSVGFLLYADIGYEFGRVLSEQFGVIHSVVYLITTIFYIFGFKNKPTFN